MDSVRGSLLVSTGYYAGAEKPALKFQENESLPQKFLFRSHKVCFKLGGFPGWLASPRSLRDPVHTHFCPTFPGPGLQECCVVGGREPKGAALL